MCLVRVNGLVGTLPVSEAQIKAMNIRSDANITVYVSAIRFTKRQITFSLTPTTNNDLAVGSRVQCTVVKATAHHVFCTFPKRGRLYDAAIRSSEFYWNRPTDVPCQPGDRINAVITGEEIIGKTKYTTLNACALTPQPAADLRDRRHAPLHGAGDDRRRLPATSGTASGSAARRFHAGYCTSRPRKAACCWATDRPSAIPSSNTRPASGAVIRPRCGAPRTRASSSCSGTPGSKPRSPRPT